MSKRNTAACIIASVRKSFQQNERETEEYRNVSGQTDTTPARFYSRSPQQSGEKTITGPQSHVARRRPAVSKWLAHLNGHKANQVEDGFNRKLPSRFNHLHTQIRERGDTRSRWPEQVIPIRWSDSLDSGVTLNTFPSFPHFLPNH